MCLLTVFTPDAKVDEKRLEDASLNNPDGFGFAMLMGDHIARFRSMHFGEVADHFMRLRDLYPDTFAIFHHRFATGGGNTVENCHPFTWAFDERFAVGHNGVLPIAPGRKKSDTRIWAEHYLNDVCPSSLDDPKWFSKVENWLGGSKVAVLSAAHETQYGLYILNEKAGHWENDVWYSNHSYELFSRAVSTFSPPKFFRNFSDFRTEQEKDSDLISCSVCFNVWEAEKDFSNLVCLECQTCWICEEDVAFCDCYDFDIADSLAEKDFSYDVGEF